MVEKIWPPPDRFQFAFMGAARDEKSRNIRSRRRYCDCEDRNYKVFLERWRESAVKTVDHGHSLMKTVA